MSIQVETGSRIAAEGRISESIRRSISGNLHRCHRVYVDPDRLQETRKPTPAKKVGGKVTASNMKAFSIEIANRIKSMLQDYSQGTKALEKLRKQFSRKEINYNS